MCGIAGILSRQIDHNYSKNILEEMLFVQSHRGPDASQFWIDDQICLGHNRLSIIDLSIEANQPMHSIDNRYVIVFNGEIYNYLELKKELQIHFTFYTSSDTEVLLNAYRFWGTNCLDKFNGMFAFAIWDKYERKLFAARDRFGVKPFYYAFSEDRLVFASEIKTLWAGGIPKNKNLKVWSNYLVQGTYGLPNETFWKDVHQLPAGHYVEFVLNDFVKALPKRWYHFIDRIKNIPTIPISELKEKYSTLLDDAVKLRFRADVAIGINVSGGLDSSTLIALVDKNLPKNEGMEAFTFYCNNPNYDEILWVEELLKNKPYHLNKVLLEVNNIPLLIDKVGIIQDEPFGGFPTLAYSLLFHSAKAKGIKVLLDGQGMDEAWAGYDYYHNQSNAVVQGLNSSPVRPEVLSNEFKAMAQKEIYLTPFESKMQNLQYRDLFYTKIPRALRFNDRISMMHSTELREPFLDYRLVELAFAQPDEIKFNQGSTKWLLRQISQEITSSNIALAPKRALQTPQREWIANELRDYVQESLIEFSRLDFVEKDKVKQIWKEYLSGNQDNSFYIWQWINLIKLL
jgi:asparagine synthase (glutamine-hydrolysing)